MNRTWMKATDMGLGRLGVEWSVMTHTSEHDDSMYTLGGSAVMKGPQWDEMRMKMDMEMSTTPGQDETDVSD